MSRLLRRSISLAAVAATTVLSLADARPSLRANELCYGAGVSGVVTAGTPTVCEPTSQPVLCSSPSTGVSPTVDVYAEACVPF